MVWGERKPEAEFLNFLGPQPSIPRNWFLKGAQVWDFDVLDFNDFFIMKSLSVGDLRAKIKVLHFLQMGEILAILF